MKNILENKFWWAAKSFAAVAVLGISVATADVFITELTDPQNSSDAGRYVELYNSGSTDIDLGAGWALQRWTNDNAEPQDPVSLTGYIPAGGFFIICNDADKFSATYGSDADQDIGTQGPADSNGDDNIALLDASETIVDMFGVAGEDGSGTAHEFEDGRAERIATIVYGNPTWDAAEWNIDNDGGAGDGEQYAPEGFDPRAWIGASTQPTGTDVTFTVTDETQSFGDIEYMGTATDWVSVQMHDDGTGADATAGDHVWTVVINVEDGDHEWGAVNFDEYGYGSWLISGYNLTFGVVNGVVTGQTDYVIEVSDISAVVTFTVTDYTQQIQNIIFKGTMSMWALIQGYDDGTNGDQVAGDHVWTAQYEAAAGDHEWGAIDTDNGDGTTCTLCDGSDGWGTWLSEAYVNYYFTVGDDGVATGDFNLNVGNPPPLIAGSWKLAPVAGAFKVGPGVDDGSWWQNSEGDVETRACLFDDEYVFHADGTFENVQGTET